MMRDRLVIQKSSTSSDSTNTFQPTASSARSAVQRWRHRASMRARRYRPASAGVGDSAGQRDRKDPQRLCPERIDPFAHPARENAYGWIGCRRRLPVLDWPASKAHPYERPFDSSEV
jgi:hypothetical protein